MNRDRANHLGGPVPSTPPARLDLVDNAKAVGIVLVVVGHAPGIGQAVSQTIYGFHMPLFFFISGFLLQSHRLALPLGGYLSSLWRTILVPYVFFFAISYLYWLPTHETGSKATVYSQYAWYEPIYSLALGYGHTNVVLWFFSCLAVTSLAYYLLRRVTTEKGAFSVIALAAVLFILFRKPSWPRALWCIDVAVVALLFYAIGRWARDRVVLIKGITKSRIVVIAIVAFTATVACTANNGRADLYELYFGSHPILFVPGALAGIVFVSAISALFRAGTVTRWLSVNTIIVFPVHGLMFSLFTGVGVVVFGMPHEFKQSSIWFGVLYAIAALLLCYPVSAFIYRFFPFVFGRRALYKANDDTGLASCSGQSITTKSGVP